MSLRLRGDADGTDRHDRLRIRHGRVTDRGGHLPGDRDVDRYHWPRRHRIAVIDDQSVGNDHADAVDERCSSRDRNRRASHSERLLPDRVALAEAGAAISVPADTGAYCVQLFDDGAVIKQAGFSVQIVYP